MVHVKPFRGFRPVPELVEQVASPPYDVLNREEAAKKAAGNACSFLHIVRSEIDVDPGIDDHDPLVYQKGIENLARFKKDGVLIQDELPGFYIYQLTMGDSVQTGLVTTVAVQDYLDKQVKVHEYTRPVKEQDRADHIDRLNTQAGPVFLMTSSDTLENLLAKSIEGKKPVYDFKADYDVQHTFYVIQDAEEIDQFVHLFEEIDAVYIADGHHRSAAAARVCEKRKAANFHHKGDEAYNFFLSVIFPSSQLRVLDYNRVVKDLNGLSVEALLKRIEEEFEVTECCDAMCCEEQCYRPTEEKTYGMYVDGHWYLLEAREGTYQGDDPIDSLDIHILQDNLLAPVLGIGDSRTDTRIHFVGGIRGLGELKRLVDSGDYAIAFSLYPTRVQQLIAVADAGEVMPAKSTWFEPKLRSGLIIHCLNS